MDQIHKRFTTEQIKVLLQGYCKDQIDRAGIEETLGILQNKILRSTQGIPTKSEYIFQGINRVFIIRTIIRI